MRYEKPTIVNLSARAANGQNPLACMPGGAVAPNACFSGAGDTACYTGAGGAESANDCLGGGEPGMLDPGSCLPGGGAFVECAAGIGPTYVGACTSGPTPL